MTGANLGMKRRIEKDMDRLILGLQTDGHNYTLTEHNRFTLLNISKVKDSKREKKIM